MMLNIKEHSLGQKAALRFGGFVILAATMQLSVYFTRGGPSQTNIWMTTLTALMAIVLYRVAKKPNYSQYVVIFITIYLNIIGVSYTLVNILEGTVDFGDILALSLVTVYSYHQAGFLISPNFLWALVTLNVGITLWPALFLRPTLADPEAPFIASVLYLVATTIIITLKNNQDSTHREISYKLELNSTQEQLTAKQAELSTTQTQLTTAQTKLAHAQSHLTDIQTQLATCHTQQRNDHNQLRAKDEEIATLKSTLEAKQAKIEQQQSQLTQSKQTLARTEQRLSNRLERITEIETQLEKLMQALFNQEVEKVYGVIVHRPKEFKHAEGQTLFWLQTERRGKIPVCYPVPIEQARAEGLEVGKRVQTMGSITGVLLSDVHTFVMLTAWQVIILHINEEDLRLDMQAHLE